jgi:hypothetical protein
LHKITAKKKNTAQLSAAAECKSHQIGIRVFSHYPQQNQMHAQSMHHGQRLTKQKYHFPEKIWFMLNLVRTTVLPRATLLANVYYSCSEMNPVPNHF